MPHLTGWHSHNSNYCKLPNEPGKPLAYCHDAEGKLSQAKRDLDKNDVNKTVAEGMLPTLSWAQLFESYGYDGQACFKEAQILQPVLAKHTLTLIHYHGSGGSCMTKVPAGHSHRHTIANSLSIGSVRSAREQLQQPDDDTIVPVHIFAKNMCPPTIEFKLPEADKCLESTPHLVWRLNVLKSPRMLEATLEPTAHKNEGFSRNGIGYIKKYTVAVYKEQDGRPVVEYTKLIDGGSWKDVFFDCMEMQLLHEASPLIRNGNQH
ncbi:MAG: hypothetical protein J3Q66DRAFT_427656 [Benniella sp.]|nr:MAG: hypothetical protein J3Q66DRAFT_427656 [Benniella sp.]